MLANFDGTPSFLFMVLLACNKLQPSKTQGCPVSPCQYGGTCVNNVCSCPPGLTGPTCSNVDCDDYPCFFRNSTCIRGPPDMCSCPPGRFPPFCTISCQDSDSWQYSCVNGVCVGDVCNCDANFAGPTCGSAIAAYLSPSAITVTEGHVGQKAVTLQVCRQPSSEEVTLQAYTNHGLALPDVDFVAFPFDARQDVTISAGQPCTPVNVFIISDLTQETMSKALSLVLYDPQPSSMVHFVPSNGFTTITIIDDDPDIEPPTIDNCPDDITVTAPAGAAATTVSWTPPTATDQSGAVTLTSSQNPGDSFTIGSTQVTYTANDGANNFASCGFTVTVVDVNECQLQTDNCDDASTTCQNTNGGFTCNCLSGFSRVNPTTCQGPCDTDPCLNGGNCLPLNTPMNGLNFLCICDGVFTGQTCEEVISPCDPNPCLNGAACTPTFGSEFTCTCLDGFTGDTCGDEREPPSLPVYLVALVIPVLIFIILLVVIIKRIRRKPATESKPEDVKDVDFVNAGVTDDHEDYIALDERSRNTPAQKYQDLTEKEAPTQESMYERTIYETADATPKAMTRQGLKRQTDYQYEDATSG